MDLSHTPRTGQSSAPATPLPLIQGFSHDKCAPGPDFSCYTFHNTECHFDGCSWYDASTFTCQSQLHGEIFVFVDVHEHCEVWSSIDAVTKITCSADGLAK